MAWKPGQSGNPRGRPRKGKTLTDILLKHGRKRDVAISEEEYITRMEALSTKIWSLALSGNMAAIKYIYDRIDGSPRQSLELSGDTEKPIGIQVVRYSDRGTDTETSSS